MTAPAPHGTVLRRLRGGIGWVREIVRDGERYLDRYTLFKQGPSGSNPWRVYLHRFLAADGDGHHNHPSRWSFSIVLSGSYTEEYFDLDVNMQTDLFALVPVRTRRVRWINFLSVTRYHRITHLHPARPDGHVWTLFVCGPLSGKGWGFWERGIGHVPQEKHFVVKDGK